MRWRSIGYEWAAVAFLLSVLLAIQHIKPEWTEVVMGSSSNHINYQAIDGDSFRAGSIEIRLHGIDAPEYRQSCDAGVRQVACGKMARDALSKLIRSKNVTCKTIDRDRYGRQVSVCRDGAVDINREMVRLGWALAYRKHAMNYVAAEQEAKAAKRGIWSWDFEKPEEYRAKNRAVHGSAVGDAFKDE